MNFIKRELLRKDKSVVWLSDKIKKSYNITLSYVNNRRQPTIPVLFDIATALKVKPSILINNYYEKPVEE